MRQCSTSKAMQATWGSDVARALMRRLKDMEAAFDVDELLTLPGRWERLTSDRAGQLSARLSANWRLICQADDHGIVVIEVVDYH